VLPGIRAAAYAAIPGLVWAVVAMHFVATPYPKLAAYHPGYLWPGNHNAVFNYPNAAQQMKVFLHRPLYPVVLPMKTLHVQWLGLRDEMIGMFGWLEFGLPHRMYLFWVFAIACAALSDLIGKSTGFEGQRLVVIAVGPLAIFLTLCAIFDAEYLSWTQVGAPMIQGVQGRYFLPLLAGLAAFIPAAVRIPCAAKLKSALAIPAFVMGAIGMVVMPILMVSTYYLH
jgi:uncharacterized membrane protein